LVSKQDFQKQMVLATASRGIAEVITHHYTQNIDLRDAKTVLYNRERLLWDHLFLLVKIEQEAIVALDSPLLNDNKITGAKTYCCLSFLEPMKLIDEIGEINDHIQAEAGHNANIIMGLVKTNH
jgi:cell division protein FtsZ